MIRIHELKITPEHFAPVVEGFKSAELRINDRDYRIGDVLSLNEWDEKAKSYTGQHETVRIVHVANVDRHLPGYVLLSVEL